MVGRTVGAEYPIPPGLTDIHAVMQHVDVGYHRAHLEDGRPLYDEVRGVSLAGIRHSTHREAGARKIRMERENPYPCDFDVGLMTGVAQRIAPRALTGHDDRGPCRKRGDDACVYIIRVRGARRRARRAARTPRRPSRGAREGHVIRRVMP